MRKPTFEGPAGRAWRSSAPSSPACLAAYLVHRPGAHPLWSCYALAVVHLRDEDGLPKANLQFPGATHEIQITAIDPESMAEPDPERMIGVGSIRWLEPADLIWQYTMTDDEAEMLLQLMVMVIVKRRDISPDSDFAAWWKATLVRTLEHHRGGGPCRS